MGPARKRAVVLGAGMGGLLAARALSDFFERVTVVERDELPSGVEPRRGVPQGRHAHAFLARGVQVAEALFPGLVDELTEAGAPQAELLRDFRFVLSGHELARTSVTELVLPSRPLLEATVRARVTAIPGVEIVDACEAIGPIAKGERVTGVRVQHQSAQEPEDLRADLVVVAMGRAGRAGAWLRDLGYRPPAEEKVKIDTAYVSRFMRLADGALGPDQGVVVGPVPGRPRALGMMRQEGDRWLVSLVGMAGDHPPADHEGFLAFAKTVAPPDVSAAITDAEPLSEPVVYKFPASVRRRYERLDRFPAGLLAFGDAISSFNPIYGQGMTVAALEAEALRQCLEAGDHDLGHRFFRAAAKAIDPAWQLAAGGDLSVPEVEGERPVPVRLMNRYVTRLHRAAASDAKVAEAFMRVNAFLAPPSAIMRPGIIARVLLRG